MIQPITNGISIFGVTDGTALRLGLGFERMLMFVTGVSNIRDVILRAHARQRGILEFDLSQHWNRFVPTAGVATRMSPALFRITYSGRVG